MSFFEWLLMGHLIGDYLFQTNWMALNKKNDFNALGVHCLIYTGAVGMCTVTFFFDKPLIDLIMWQVFVFLSHVVIDGGLMVEKWLHVIGSKSYERTAEIIAKDPLSPASQYAIAYTALVQTVADNTLHLVFMIAAYRFLFSL